MKVRLEDGHELLLEDEPAGRGGMGTGYLTLDRKSFVKLFHKPSAELERALSLILRRYNCTRDPQHPEREAYWSGLYLWPKALVTEPRLGVLMDRLPEGVSNLVTLFGPKNYAKLPLEARSWRRRVEVAWRLAQAVARMHQLGVAHSDLSHNNVLANPLTGQVCIIDIDGLVVPGFVHPTVAGTTGYIAPEILISKGAPGVRADRHALAILIYRLLLFAHPLKGPYTFGIDPFEVAEVEQRQLSEDGIYIAHPTDPRNRPKKGFYHPSILGAVLEGLFERAFVQGLKVPEARPLAQDFRLPLGHILERLVECTNVSCVERYYPVQEGRSIVCPWCGTLLDAPGGIPVVRLYDPGPQGPVLQRDYWVVASPGKALAAWHVQPGLEPDGFQDPAPLVRFERGPSGWQIHNLNLVGLSKMTRGGVVESLILPGTVVPMVDGMVLRLGPPRDSRLALIQWIR